MIRITMLGTFRVDANGAELPVASLQPKRLALLAYLAVARPTGSHRRDTIVGLLWPELDQDRARSALRQALHALRKALGPNAFVTTGNEAVALDRAVVSCDLWDLDDAADAGNPDRVIAMYHGDLAAGLFVSDAPAFDEWLDGERGRVRATVRESAWRAATDAATRRLAGECVEQCRLALSLSVLDEAAARRAMQLAASVGERAAALSFYETLATALRRELDTEPSSVTRAVADEIRRADAPVASRVEFQRPLHIARELPSRHVRRSPTRTMPRIAAAAAAAIVAITVGARLAPSAPSMRDPRTVLVAPFDNESRAGSLDAIARSVTTSARDALVRLDNVRLLADRADDSDAGTIVRGSIRAEGDSIELRADVVDTRTGIVARTITTRFASASQSPGVAVNAFADRVSTAVATALYPGWGAALSQPPSYAGYRAFVDGMRNIKRERHDLAIAAFRGAYDADSSFTAAGLLAAIELYQARQFLSSDSIARAIAIRRAMLPSLDAHLLDWLQHSLGGDRLAARAAMVAVVTIAPTADLAWLQLAIDNVETGRPNDALAALDHIDPEGDFGEGWVAYWATRIEALHFAADHERELAVAREGLRRHPELRVLASYELRALAALGRVAEIERATSAMIGAPAVEGFDPRAALRQTALELAAHGYAPASRQTLRVVRDWYDARPASEHASLAYQLGRARTAYLSDDRGDARRLYAGILQAHPKCTDCIGALGVLAARDGDGTSAERSLTTLAAIVSPFLFGRPLEWQARITATLGDTVRAATLQSAAFASGAELDIMTHTDADLRAIHPDSLYRAFARVGP